MKKIAKFKFGVVKGSVHHVAAWCSSLYDVILFTPWHEKSHAVA